MVGSSSFLAAMDFVNGAKKTFHLSGIVLSPEFVFEAPPNAALPDNKTYGVFWMPYKELATAFQLYGAFNSVALTLAPGASERDVIVAINRVLAPYGARGAYGRIDHPSHRRVDDEIRVLQGLSVAFPLVFLSVAAFMTNSVMSRQIALQREQIAVDAAGNLSTYSNTASATTLSDTTAPTVPGNVRALPGGPPKSRADR